MQGASGNDVRPVPAEYRNRVNGGVTRQGGSRAATDGRARRRVEAQALRLSDGGGTPALQGRRRPVWDQVVTEHPPVETWLIDEQTSTVSRSLDLGSSRIVAGPMLPGSGRRMMVAAWAPPVSAVASEAAASICFNIVVPLCSEHTERPTD